MQPSALAAAKRSTALNWLRLFFSSRYRVANLSMLPTLQPGDRLLVDRLRYHWLASSGPRRGELAVFRHPERSRLEAIKRVVGLPGERVALQAGQLSVDGTPVPEPYLEQAGLVSAGHEWQLGADEYLVLGDNRLESRDSRQFGPLRRQLLLGPAWYRYWPTSARGPLSGL